MTDFELKWRVSDPIRSAHLPQNCGKCRIKKYRSISMLYWWWASS